MLEALLMHICIYNTCIFIQYLYTCTEYSVRVYIHEIHSSIAKTLIHILSALYVYTCTICTYTVYSMLVYIQKIRSSTAKTLTHILSTLYVYTCTICTYTVYSMRAYIQKIRSSTAKTLIHILSTCIHIQYMYTSKDMV